MRLDLDLAVGEQLGDDAGEQQVVGFVDFDGRRCLQPRGEVGQPDAPGRRKPPRCQTAVCVRRRAPR